MFPLMFTVVSCIVLLGFVVVAVGFVRHARFARKMFTLAERELDQKLSESTEPEKVRCTHASTSTPVGAHVKSPP